MPATPEPASQVGTTKSAAEGLVTAANNASSSGDHASAVAAAEKLADLAMANVDGKPGWKTTEFWFTVVTIGAGLWCMGAGKFELGAALMGLTQTGYALSRGLAKKGTA